ncbi:MAG TPA: hypothetical protein VLF62_05500 [Candidatus Saccharimonadales bacterium]|nr:hypothetical protein [Candidatus Saccharimonadales bacterium]
MPNLLFDQFLAATPAGEIAQRQAFAIETYQAHGFTPETAIAIGGSAFALAGLDGRIVYGNEEHGFDLDVVVQYDEIERLYRNQYDLPADFSFAPTFSSKGEPHVDAFTRMGGRQQGQTFYDLATPAASVVINGCRTVTPEVAASLRLTMGIRRGKAALGVIKAHGSAFRQEMELAEDPKWQALVVQACHNAQKWPTERLAWFDELYNSPKGMALHPAFAFMAKDPWAELPG